MSPYALASTLHPLTVAEPEVGYSGALESTGPAASADSAPPDSDPTSPDALEALGDEIATLAAHIHAATQRFLALVAEFDARRGWEWAGHRSCAHWLAARTGYTLATAQEKVRVARTLAELPETSAAMARGELSFSQVRALARVATPETEGVLLELGRGLATDKLERVVRGWRRGTREEEVDRERELYDARTFSVFPDEEGMYVVRGKLPPEVGALLMRAIEAASDTLYREARRGRRERGSPRTRRPPAPPSTPSSPARRPPSVAPMPWACWPSGPWRPGWGRLGWSGRPGRPGRGGRVSRGGRSGG
jgi:hypothetical protein